ncbi:MAG TPA: LPS assembly protein LptD [Nitrospirota bacterium]|nr:LPS assembly protein LptD [Nitrospirota bacterium]
MKRTGTAVVIVAVGLLSGLLITGAAHHAQAQDLSKKVPVTVTADKLDYDRTSDVYIALGHVKIDQEGIHLEADKVVLNNRTGQADAEGSVYLQDAGNVVRAESVKVNLNTSAGIITKGDLFMKKDNYHVKGDVIERRSETTYHIKNGQFTTCDENEWYIKANAMDIDMTRYATGNGVTFNVDGRPILYTPYFLFPVRRQSGFLIPVPGYDSRQGFFIENAFFWAISDFKDMTFSSDYRSRIGNGTGIEYRYMNSRESLGQVYAKIWTLYNESATRWEFQFKHQEEFADDLSFRANINLVSDYSYYYDLDQRLEMKSLPYLDSNAFYVERWNTESLYLLGQYSTDLTQSNDKTVQKLPELRYTIYEETLGGPVHVNFEGSATNFVMQSGNGTRRMDFNPELTAPFGSHGLNLTPRAGVRATFYDQGPSSTGPSERKFAYWGIDLNARVSRIYGADGESGIGQIRHSIEPTVSYTYIPFINQANIPQFDTVDTVMSMNTTTVSLTNRLTAHYRESKDSPVYTTYDLMVMKLSQAYNLSAVQVPNGHVRSDVLGELYLKTPKLFSATANADYNTYEHAMSSHSMGATFTTDRLSLNLSEQYLLEPETQSLIGGGLLHLARWDLGAQLTRDMVHHMNTQLLYTVNYSSQCWGIKTAYTIQPGESRFTAMLELKGMGGYQGKK